MSATYTSKSYDGRYYKLTVSDNGTGTFTVTLTSTGGSSSNYAVYNLYVKIGNKVLWDIEKASWSSGTFPTGTGSVTKTVTMSEAGVSYGDSTVTVKFTGRPYTSTSSTVNNGGSYKIGWDTYKITYNANGGTGAPGSQTKYYGKAITLSSTVPTFSGWTFCGWATSAANATAGTVAHSSGKSYTSNAAITLYAVWKKTITITYNLHGGTFDSSKSNVSRSSTIYYSTTSKSFTMITPTFSGWTLVGWSTSSSATSSSYTAGTAYSFSASTTLYAIWKKTLKLTYDANGGTAGSTTSQSSTIYYSTSSHKFTIPATASPTRTNYIFLGWSASSNASTSSYASGSDITLSASDTLYAVWELAYIRPTISNLQCYRCDSNGSRNDEGLYCHFSFSWSCDQTIGANYGLKYTYSLGNVIATTTVNFESSTTSGSVSKTIGGSLPIEQNHTLTVYLYDTSGQTVNYTYDTAMFESANFVMDFLNDGTGVAFGKPSTTSNLLDVDWDMNVSGALKANNGTKTPFHTEGNLSFVNRKLTWSGSSYRDHVILLVPVLTETNQTPVNILDGKFILWKTGANLFDSIEVMVNCAYNALKYSIRSVGDMSDWNLCVCSYNGISYYALKCPYKANPYVRAEFIGHVKSDMVGGTDTVTLPLDIAYYKQDTSEILNAEVYESITDTLTTTYVTSVTNLTTSYRGDLLVAGSGRFIKSADLSGTSNNRPALIVGGDFTETHMEIDSNEIQAKNSYNTTAQLSLNYDGGNVKISAPEYDTTVRGDLVIEGERIDTTGRYYSTHEDLPFNHTHGTTGKRVSFGVGSSGHNRGVWDAVEESWIICNKETEGFTYVANDLVVGGHSTAIGSRVTSSNTTSFSISASTWTEVTSITLPAGSWVVHGTVRYTSGYSGMGSASINTSVSGNLYSRNHIYHSTTGAEQLINVTGTFVFSASTKVYVNAWKSVASKVTSGYIAAMRIA